MEDQSAQESQTCPEGRTESQGYLGHSRVTGGIPPPFAALIQRIDINKVMVFRRR